MPDIDRFVSHWKEEIEKLENATLSPHEAELIRLPFEINLQKMKMTPRYEKYKDGRVELDNVKSALYRVLAAARTRYSLEKQSIWARVASGLAGAMAVLQTS